MKASKTESQAYRNMHSKTKPTPPYLANALRAFFIGGTICVFGQMVYQVYQGMGMTPKDAAGPLAGTMIFVGALLTGLGVYDRIGRFAGMGSALPITGFANSIVSPAMEFKREGLVLGVGARMFEVAGPVLVYGLVVSFLVGLIRYLMGAF